MTIYRMQASFGCLNQQTLTLSEGFNLITAPNESGKSTWCAFLVAMLYGLNTRSREKKGTPAEKNRYRPWSGGPLEGLLECDYLGRRLILRRSSESGIPLGSFSAVWAESGESPPALTGENVGERLTGVSREVFERSVLFRQSSLSVNESTELEQRITSLLSSADEQSSWSSADARLREWQRSRRYNKNGALPQLEEDAQQYRLRIEQLRGLWEQQEAQAAALAQAESALEAARAEDKATHKAHRANLERRWAAAAAEVDAAQLYQQSIDEASLSASDAADTSTEEALEAAIHRRGTRLLLAAALFLPVCLLLFLPFVRNALPSWVPAFAITLMGLVVLGLNLLRLRLDKRDAAVLSKQRAAQSVQQGFRAQQEKTRVAAEAREHSARQLYVSLSRELQANSHRSEAVAAAEALVSQKQQSLALLTGRLQELGDLAQLEEALAQTRAEQEKLQLEYDALSLAIAALEAADQSLRARFSPELNRRTAAYFSRLTEGAYENVLFARDFSAQTEQAGSPALRSALLLSQGTLDQLYFALRLAICELVLPKGSALPLILDDALCSFDDKRATLALSLLGELSQTRQILFFSCQSREEGLLSGIPKISHQSLSLA